MKPSEKELKDYLHRDIEAMRSVNFSEAHIKTVTENTRKWAAIGLLSGADDTHIGRNLATLMESQRLLNENLGEAADGRWRRTSIPVVRRVFGEKFVPNELISVQAMKDSNENTYLVGFDGRTMGGMTESQSRPLQSKWEKVVAEEIEGHAGYYSYSYKGFKHQLGIDAEAESTHDLSVAIRNEYTREIIRDLAQTAGKSTIYNFQNEAHLLSLVEGMSAYIAAKCYNREATWLVTSPRVVGLLGEWIEPVEDKYRESENGIFLVGTLNKQWKVYEDTTAPAGNILMGLKDHRTHYFSGYVFAPYLPVYLHAEGSQSQLMGRYGKRIVNPNFYGTIKIENLPEVTPLENVENEENTPEVKTEGGVPSDTK